MSRFIRISVLAAATAALVACGGGAKIGGGKEGAAKAMFEASQPASKGGQGNLLQMLQSGATANVEAEVNCSHGGSAKLKLDTTSSNDTSGALKFEVEYKSCNEDGANEFDGKLVMEMKFDLSTGGGSTSGTVTMKIKGKVDISGEIDDYIDADVTEIVDIDATKNENATVTIKLNGTIKTSTNSYTYANESITLTAGDIPAEEDDGGNS